MHTYESFPLYAPRLYARAENEVKIEMEMRFTWVCKDFYGVRMGLVCICMGFIWGEYHQIVCVREGGLTTKNMRIKKKCAFSARPQIWNEQKKSLWTKTRAAEFKSSEGGWPKLYMLFVFFSSAPYFFTDSWDMKRGDILKPNGHRNKTNSNIRAVCPFIINSPGKTFELGNAHESYRCP